MWRWLNCLTPPRVRRRRRGDVLAEASRYQAAEHKRAVARMQSYARDWDGPNFGGPPTWVGQSRTYPAVRRAAPGPESHSSDDRRDQGA
jgi:hypothetical protein